MFQVWFGCIGIQPIVQGSTKGLYKMPWELEASGWFGWNTLTSLVTVGAKIKWEAEAKDNVVNEKTSWLLHKQNKNTANFILLQVYQIKC